MQHGEKKGYLMGTVGPPGVYRTICLIERTLVTDRLTTSNLPLFSLSNARRYRKPNSTQDQLNLKRTERIDQYSQDVYGIW